MAITPLRMLLTMWRKKRSSGVRARRRPARAPDAASVGDGGVPSASDARGVPAHIGIARLCTGRQLASRGKRTCLSPTAHKSRESCESTVTGRRVPTSITDTVIELTDLSIRSVRREVGCRLQLFPLVHQVADLPHQRLVAVDDRLRGGAIVVEARAPPSSVRCSRMALLALGDSRFERLDPRAAAPARLAARLRASASARFFSLARLAAASLAAARRSAARRPRLRPCSRLLTLRLPSAPPLPAAPARVRPALPCAAASRVLLVPEELLVGARDRRRAVPSPISMIFVASRSTK